jgi:hypothetical protein
MLMASARKYAVKLTWKLEFRDWFFHLDSAPSHPPLAVHKFLAKTKWLGIPHPV